MKTEQLTRAFFDAAAELAEHLVRDLKNTDPAIEAEVSKAVASGECLSLSADFDDAEPAVRLALSNDYGTVRNVLSVKPTCAARH